ncbi:MAG: sigma-70 family RNA polymerase sigma factor [Chloroflexota bacterium]
MDPRPDEADLIARSRKGELAAFNCLVEHYQTPIFNLCLRMLTSTQTAEDAAQEAFIAAYKHLDKFRGGSFRSWLFRIAANACYDELRRRRARPAASLEEPTGEDDRRLDVADDAPSPEERAEQSELRQTLSRALAELPEDQRLAITLCDVQGLDYAEIAEVMECSLGTVKSRISRGRLRLRAILLERAELLPARFRPTGEEP